MAGANRSPFVTARSMVLRKPLIGVSLQVFGGSWGSTLALAYSMSHPDKVY